MCLSLLASSAALIVKSWLGTALQPDSNAACNMASLIHVHAHLFLRPSLLSSANVGPQSLQEWQPCYASHICVCLQNDEMKIYMANTTEERSAADAKAVSDLKREKQVNKDLQAELQVHRCAVTCVLRLM